MEFNLKILKSYSLDNIKSFFYDTFLKNYYAKFAFAFDEEEFMSLVVPEILNILKNMTEKEEKVWRKVIEKNLNTFLMDDSNRVYKIILEFINQNFKNINHFNVNFNKLVNFLMELNYLPQEDVIKRLINESAILRDTLEKIVQKNHSLIENSSLTDVFEDDISLTFLRCYCEMNGIQIKEVDLSDEGLMSGVSDYSADLVKVYLREIGGVKLLSIEEEKAIAKRVSEGDEEARQLFISSNLRLVVSIAKKYIPKTTLSFLDLIQEGNLGLIKAVERYDYTKSYKFSTYATWWIKQAITRGMADKGRTIRLPVHVNESMNKIKKSYTELQDKLKREPTIEELAEYIGYTPERIKDILYHVKDITSLDVPVGEEEDTTLGDFVADERTSDVEEKVVMKSLREVLDKALDTLQPREAAVLKARTGYDDDQVKTLEEVGQDFNVTRERIRQIEAKALRKLRHPSRRKLLAGYYDGFAYEKLSKEEKEPKSPQEELESMAIDQEAPDEASKKEYPKIKVVIPHSETKKYIIKPPTKKSSKKSTAVVKERKVMKKVQPIFEREEFQNYKREDILKIIESLPVDYKRIINLYYGPDLNNPVTSSRWNSRFNDILHKQIFPRILYELKVLKGEIIPVETTSKEVKTIFNDPHFEGYTREEILAVIQNLPKYLKKLVDVKWGLDLDFPWTSDISENDSLMIENALYPRILKDLEKLRSGQDLSKNSRGGRQIISIFKLPELAGYTEEDIRQAISELSERHKMIIYSRWGENLDGKNLGEGWRPYYRKILKDQIIPAIIIKLARLTKETTVFNEIESIVTEPVIEEPEDSIPVIEIKEKTPENDDTPSSLVDIKTYDLRKAYLKAISLLRTPYFMKLLIDRSLKESIVFCLLFVCYSEGLTFDAGDLAKILEISDEESKVVLKNSLSLFKDSMTQFISRVDEELITQKL